MNIPTQKLAVFLTFSGKAEDAMHFYEDILPGASIESITRYKANQPMGDTGKVLNGALNFGGQQIMFMDMAAAQPAPGFSWSTSLFIWCADEAEFDKIFAELSAGGSIMMGPEKVMELRKVAWVTDKFGVTWQLVWK